MSHWDNNDRVETMKKGELRTRRNQKIGAKQGRIFGGKLASR
jgi:hypothetical protein